MMAQIRGMEELEMRWRMSILIPRPGQKNGWQGGSNSCACASSCKPCPRSTARPLSSTNSPTRKLPASWNYPCQRPKSRSTASVKSCSPSVSTRLTREDQMAAYRKARRLMFRRTVIWAIMIAFALLAFMSLVILAVFFTVPI